VSRLVFFLNALLAALAVSGCATSPDADPRDPLEPMNRAVYKFNDGFDDYVAKPIAGVYKDMLHVEIRSRVSNFFSNIQDIFIGVNNVLQGKFQEGIEDWARFVFNSTIGLAGIHDVASDMGIEKHNEDFGQTFGRWGVGSGPYLILPFLGSSTLRDAGGTAVDLYFAPLAEVRPIALRNSLYGLYFVNTRAELLEASSILEQAALDRYVFQRDAYLQRRRSLIYDGSPPREREEEVNDQPPQNVK
jgi:phospholipid-binding lipoprotein MlaA